MPVTKTLTSGRVAEELPSTIGRLRCRASHDQSRLIQIAKIGEAARRLILISTVSHEDFRLKASIIQTSPKHANALRPRVCEGGPVVDCLLDRSWNLRFR